MHKKSLRTYGVILIIFDILIYGLLHDCTKLSIIRKFSYLKIFEKYKNIQNQFAVKYSDLYIFKISRNYLVDLLWYISFLVIVFESVKSKSKYFIIISMGIISELVQLFFPIFGTFDYIDLSIYLVITIVVYFYEKSQSKINENKYGNFNC